MHAIIYARVSPKPKKAAEKNESLALQIEQCIEHCQRKGYDLDPGDIFQDDGFSGADPNRPGLWEAVEACETKKDCVLLVFRLDRLSRDMYLYCIVKQKLEKAKCILEAVQGGIFGDSPEQKMIAQILQTVSEYERVIIGIRTKLAMQRKLKRGEKVSSKPPFGYKEDETGKKYIVNPVEVAAIGAIMLAHKQGLTLRKIRDSLLDQGFRPRGKTWHISTIRSLILKHDQEGLEVLRNEA